MWNYNFFLYITTNPSKTTLYVGITNDLHRRLQEHEANKGKPETFAGRYYCHWLVYYERHTNIEHAIAREKEIKKWRREKKIALIQSINPELRFLNKEVMPD
ncbi:GIY-YIG nuclease family protein [Mucilaginibacter sp. Bleaf8]|uniref:GIY-YIG nuclease family protein n=1 Tax=Mucilaginibacter sp. Bleaf8 TaxID=2834430 RepID=UPI001BCADD5A|nr:GIY-YIG nuclease family protein [Mucilaginibacter sp. Bleaf8]MBS7564381.1 GIY-YIG nuclease family protein [Mucilaginibacter sp. Bleaf8]